MFRTWGSQEPRGETFIDYLIMDEGQIFFGMVYQRYPFSPEKIATRVAGSDFLAIRLGDDIIVSSMKEYEEKAVSLLLNCPKLQDLTNRLKAACLSYPLFNA